MRSLSSKTIDDIRAPSTKPPSPLDALKHPLEDKEANGRVLTRYDHESAHVDDQDLVAASLLEAFVTCGKVALLPDGPRSAITDIETQIEQDKTHGDRRVERGQ